MELSNDLLQNLANLTQQLKQNQGSPTNNVDITGIYEENLLPNPNNQISVQSNVPGLTNKLENIENRFVRSNDLEANRSTINETNRILSLNPQNDDHSEFKIDVKELSKIETLISEYTEIISKLKKKKTELRQKTLEHMVKHKIDTAKVTKKESFSVVTSKRKVNPTTKTRLPHKIRDFFIKEEKMDDHKAEQLAKKIVKWIHDNAEYNTMKSLRHSKKK